MFELLSFFHLTSCPNKRWIRLLTNCILDEHPTLSSFFYFTPLVRLSNLMTVVLYKLFITWIMCLWVPFVVSISHNVCLLTQSKPFLQSTKGICVSSLCWCLVYASILRVKTLSVHDHPFLKPFLLSLIIKSVMGLSLPVITYVRVFCILPSVNLYLCAGKLWLISYLIYWLYYFTCLDWMHII